MSLGLLYATILPFIWGFMNVFDKYILSHKVKHAIAFAVVTGIVNISLGLIILPFLTWNYPLSAYLFPILAGILLGIQFYVYYQLLSTEDSSSLTGFVYTYPLLIAIASYFILDEVISPLGYIGMAFTVSGALLLSLRLHRVRLTTHPGMIVLLVILIASYEFLVKMATTTLPPLHGTAISSVMIGLTLLPALFVRDVRVAFAREIKLLPWACMSEALTLLAVAMLFFAMNELPATIVASFGATQPLIVLVLERLAHTRFGSMSKDTLLLPKLGSISLIVIGAVLLYASAFA